MWCLLLGSQMLSLKSCASSWNRECSRMRVHFHTKFQSSPAHILDNNYRNQIHRDWSCIAEGMGDIPLCLSAMHILHTLLFAFSSCAIMNLCLDSFDLSWFLFIFFSNAMGMRSATIDDVVLLYVFFIFAKVIHIFENINLKITPLIISTLHLF